MEKEQNAIMLKEESSVGSVRIAEPVVAMIASIAATEVEGVQIPGGHSAKGAKATKGVKVEIKDGVVQLDMAVAILYGYHIPEVSGQLQSRIKNAIENMTGLSCGNINIRFSGVVMK